MASSLMICSSCREALRRSLRRTAQRSGNQVLAQRNLAGRPQIRPYTIDATILASRNRASQYNSIPRHRSKRDGIGVAAKINDRQIRLLSSSAHQNEAIINPRNDEDGNPMEVQITPRAANVMFFGLVKPLCIMLRLCAAVTTDHDQRCKSQSLPPCICRVWWLPRIPVPHVINGYKKGLTRR